MKYYIDTEFNGWKGELISLAIIREDNEACYFVLPAPTDTVEWVSRHVMPYLWNIPSPLPGMAYTVRDTKDIGWYLHTFLKDDKDVVIYADWPDDIKYINECLITDPGMMVNLDNITFKLKRCDTRFVEIAGAVDHNAYWDAMKIKVVLELKNV